MKRLIFFFLIIQKFAFCSFSFDYLDYVGSYEGEKARNCFKEIMTHVFVMEKADYDNPLIHAIYKLAEQVRFISLDQNLHFRVGFNGENKFYFKKIALEKRSLKKVRIKFPRWLHGKIQYEKIQPENSDVIFSNSIIKIDKNTPIELNSKMLNTHLKKVSRQLRKKDLKYGIGFYGRAFGKTCDYFVPDAHLWRLMH